MTTQAHADLRTRRENLHLSRERLARQADCSAISIELLEGGWRPKRSKVLPALIATLARLEAAQTNEAAAGNGDLAKLGAGAAGHGSAA
jgi:predicted transcriptional regulator